MKRHRGAPRGAFTLVELLIVLAIIVVLIGILIPVVGKVRKSARTATVQNQLNVLVSQIENYHGDQGAYPGPLSEDQIYNPNEAGDPNAIGVVTPAPGFDTTTWNNTKVTQAENLVLGLCGGLRTDTNGKIVYDPSLVGTGPNSLGATPKKYPSFADAKNLSWKTINGKSGMEKTGHFKDDAGEADDSIIPEFVDEFSNPMPILYLRARVGAQGNDVGNVTVDVIQDTSAGQADSGQQYDLKDIVAYTRVFKKAYIGVGRSARIMDQTKLPPTVTMKWGIPHGLQTVCSPLVAADSTGGAGTSSLDKSAGGGSPAVAGAGRKYMYPYDAYAYFEDPSKQYVAGSATTGHPGLARAKDRYILISAGADRTYGTEDDICSFGALFP
jgi:prepilin-type N-terminal cleavage/methylation domain-containing protein